MFVRRLYAKGKLSIDEAIKVAEEENVGVSCAEGVYTEEYMYGSAFEYIVLFLLDNHCYIRSTEESCPIIEPIKEGLARKQLRWLNLWMKNDGRFFDEPRDSAYRALYTVPWRFTKVWRKKYPDIPILESVTN
jgi:hypothetical protein